jgi:hypothetical protein
VKRNRKKGEIKRKRGVSIFRKLVGGWPLVYVFRIRKRVRFIVSSLILSLGFLGIGFLGDGGRMVGILVLGVLTAVFLYWSLWEGLRLNASLLALILPLFYTLGVGVFWFLLPSSWFSRLPVVFVYAVGIYALCSTMNIFTVSAIRNIALVRAARGVGFVATLFVCFLVFDAVFSLRLNVFLSSGLVFVLVFPLFLQGLWMSKLESVVTGELLLMSLVFSYCVGVISMVMYFWPVSVVVGSLFLTVSVYELLGLGQVELEGKLFGRTVREYLMVGVLVFFSMLMATSWRG